MKPPNIVQASKIDQIKSSSSSNFKDLVVHLPLVLALVTILIGVYQFNLGRELDYKKTIFDARIQAYGEMADAIAQVVNFPKDEKERAETLRRFKLLRDGKTFFIQDGSVLTLIYKFNRWVSDCVEGKGGALPSDGECSLPKGRASATKAIEAMRASAVETFDRAFL